MQVLNPPNQIKENFVSSLEKWLEKNRDLIGEKWERLIKREIKKFGKRKATIPVVCGFALWSFNVVCNLGVTAVIGLDGFEIHDCTWKRGFDRETTEKLILWCSEALRLMQIPKEVAKELGWG